MDGSINEWMDEWMDAPVDSENTDLDEPTGAE